MPAYITNKLAAAVERTLADATLRQRFASVGVDVFGGGPQEFQNYIVAQIANWMALIKDAGIEPEG